MCTSTPGPWVADPHSTSLPGTTIQAVAIQTPPHVSLSHKGTGGHFVGPDMQFIGCSFFHFRCAVLSCNRGRIGQKGPNRFKPGPKSSSMAILPVGIAGADSWTSYFVGCGSEKGGAILFQQAATFFIRGPGAIKNSTIGRSPSPIKCVLWFIPNR